MEYTDFFFSLSYRATNLYLNRFGVLIKVKKQMGVVLMKHWQNLLMDMLCYKRRIYTTITKKVAFIPLLNKSR